MSNDKRMVVTLVLTVASVWGLNELLVRTGVIPRQPIVDPAAEAAQADPADGKAKAKVADKPPRAKDDLPDNVFAPNVVEAKDREKPKDVPALKPGPKLVNLSELVLGSDQDSSPSGYHIRVQLDQRGASVLEATSAKYDAEYDPTLPRNKGRGPRLKLIDTDPMSDAPGSLAMVLTSAAKAPRPISDDPDDAAAIEPPKVEAALDSKAWEVVRDKDNTPVKRAVTKTDPTTQAKVEGEEVAFRFTADDPAVNVTKVYRLWKGEDGFEVELRFSSPSKDSKFTYKLFGPHGIPIEGEWYTSTFRDVFFDQVGARDITTRASTDVVKAKGVQERLATLPLKFAGVEDQYFATFVQPWPIPKTQEDRWDLDSAPVVFTEDKKAPQKSDVGVEINSRPLLVGPNLGEVVHTYRVFAGPKQAAALLPYEAEELASYRKNWLFSIPFAGSLAKYVISPLLDKIYGLTQSVAHVFGWENGNYGIAIILLTMTVRMMMFPLGRKQAMMAKKMQDLQPVLAQVKEKYKDDKEALTRETMNVWKQHKINPAAGCVPALIQMPIFVGLWQSLNNSVALRHSSFLYIRDLAAPDMLFHLPFTIPWINADYFNLLPFLVVSLMLVQTKLFSPPPTTPEAEMNQKMMKYMMILMAFMFYKVPSGLGLYFITSSLWQIGERLLLPKVIASHPKPAIEGGDLGDRGKGPGPSGNGNGNGKGSGPQGWLGKRIEKLLEEAAKDTTIRNADRAVGGRDREREQDRERERDRTRPRPRPGKRR